MISVTDKIDILIYYYIYSIWFKIYQSENKLLDWIYSIYLIFFDFLIFWYIYFIIISIQNLFYFYFSILFNFFWLFLKNFDIFWYLNIDRLINNINSIDTFDIDIDIDIDIEIVFAITVVKNLL